MRRTVCNPTVRRRQPVPSSTQGELPRDTPLVALAYSHAPLPEVALEFLNGPSQSMSRPVHRVMSLIGSASGCKFRLTDPSVSRFHGSLLRTSAGLWIVDLLGQRGITVNEVPVRFSRLADGDVLRIGRYQIRVRCRLRGQGSGNGLPDRGRATLVPRLLASGPCLERSQVSRLGSGRVAVRAWTGVRRRHNSPCRSKLFPRFPRSRSCLQTPPSPSSWLNPS